MTDILVPRAHQNEAKQAIRAARDAGRPGFLLGDMTGLGKTLSAWLALAEMTETEVLIICPKGAIPQWRRTILLSGMPPKDVTILNYEKTKSLLVPPEASRKRSTRAKNNELAKLGTPKRVWPLVVFDEAHRLRNPNSQQSMACRQMAEAAHFAVYLSATAGQAPHELSYLGRLLGHAAGLSTNDLAGFRDLMKHLKIGTAKGRWKNWKWKANEHDRTVMSDLLYKGNNAIGLRRRPADIAGWPEIDRALAPIALDTQARRLYDSSWREFRKEIGLAGGSTRQPKGRVIEIRFRQKASLLRVAGQVDFVEDLLLNGQQAAISVAFLETGLMLETALRSRGWKVGQINGTQNAEVNESIRRSYQTGNLDAVIFTVTESISLHQGELLGGHRPRTQVIHDMRHSAIQLQQIEGRSNRDGRGAMVYYTYAENTVEEAIAAKVVARMALMDGMAGDDTAMLDEIAELIETAASS